MSLIVKMNNYKYNIPVHEVWIYFVHDNLHL